ncbi:MAG TPA: hypothetical protein VFX85_00140, partial [Solirubrobacterales bacterium]|nr:hypothetical protein [Solirubrobacterales bacterium]
STYVAFRGPSGWTTQGVMPTTRTEYLSVQLASQFSADLSAAVVSSSYPVTADTLANTGNFFRRDNTTGRFQLLSPRPNGVQGDGVANIFDGIGSADLTTYAFMAEHPLRDGDPEPVGGQGYLIYKHRIGGELELVANNANVGWGRAKETAMSADGSRLFYTSPGINGDQYSQGSLYLSEDGSPPIEVSASQLPTPEPTHEVAQFVRATPDGSKVLFASTERLNEESNADGGATVHNEDIGDLYVYDVESGSLRDISSSAPSGGRAMGVLGASTDLSKVYFVDKAVLAPGGVEGSPNLYFWDSAAGVSFAGALAAGDTTTWTGVVTERQSRVSADGSAVVFQSRAAIGGYDPDGHVGVYYYRGGGAAPVCISCGPEGTAEADAQLVDRFFANAWNHQARFVSDDGRRAFFTSAGALVGRDTNGKLDAYQWDAEAGRLALISSGQGESDSVFLDASPDGGNAFFSTRDRLVGGDADTLVDAYVARVGGGFPEPPFGPGACAGEGCKPSRSAPPPGAAPSSSSYFGPGSAKPRTRCAKPTRKRKAAKAKSKARGKATRQRAHARNQVKAKKKKQSQRKSCRGGRS